MGTAVGALLGIGGGIVNELIHGKANSQLQKQKQKWLDKTEARNLQQEERIQTRNPEADRRYQESVLRGTMADAKNQAANSVAGASGSSNGDTQNFMGQGIKSSAAVGQAASPYAQGIAQSVNSRQQAEAQQEANQNQVLNNAVNIESQRLYTNTGDENGNNFLNAITAGAVSGDNIHRMVSNWGGESTGDDVIKDDEPEMALPPQLGLGQVHPGNTNHMINQYNLQGINNQQPSVPQSLPPSQVLGMRNNQLGSLQGQQRYLNPYTLQGIISQYNK